MAQLKNLLLQGVRSFGSDHDERQAITFDSPMTLILGRNGCGKTTIIEALKYSCTGSLPAGQGVAFVRDPKLDRLMETRGQVKLLLNDLRGKELTCTRSLQVSQRAKKMEFKTLDSTVQTEDQNGKVVNLSSRCCDVDEYMCTSFGVSKAILSNVIFCHQEDSYWPLDEGKKVKDKFDEIFDATKYNKCLEQIRAVRKKYIEEAKVYTAELNFLRQNFEAATAKRRELETIRKRWQDAQDKIKELKDQLVPLEEEFSVWTLKEQNYSETKSKHDNKKTMLQAVRAQQDEVCQNIKVIFTGTKEELQEAIKSFTQQLQTKKDSLAKLKKQIQTHKNKEEDIQAHMNRTQKELGELQAEEKLHKEKCGQRNLVLGQLAQDLGLPNLSENADDINVKDKIAEVEHALLEAKNALENSRRKHQADETNLQKEIDSCLVRRTKLDQEVKSKAESIQSTCKELDEIRAKLKDVDSSAERLHEVEQDLLKYRSDLEKIQKTVNVDDLTKEIANHSKTCKNLEERQRELTTEVMSLQKHSSDQKELEIKERKKQELEISIRRLRAKHEEGIDHLLKDVNDSNLKHEVEKLQEKLDHDIQELKQQISEKERDITRLETDRKHQKEELNNLERELRSSQDELYELCGRQDFNTVLAEVEKSIQEVQNEKATLGSSQYMFNRYIEKLHRDVPCCPLCQRGFDDQQDALELANELTGKVNTLPGRIQDTEERLTTLLTKQSKLLALKPKHERTRTLRTVNIPSLKTRVESIEEELDSAQQEITGLQGSLTVPMEDLRIVKSMLRDILIIDQQNSEKSRVQRDIGVLKAKLPSSGSERTVDQAMSEQQNVQSELSKVRAKKETLEGSVNHYNKQVNSLKELVNNTVADQLQIQKKVQQRVQLEERQNELNTVETVLQAELEDLQEKVLPARKSFDSASTALKNAKLSHQRAFDSERTELQTKKVQMGRVINLVEDIEDYKCRGTANILSDKKLEISDLSQELKNVKNQMEKISEQSNLILEDIANQEVKERELEDNMILLGKKELEAKLQEEMSALKTELGNLNYPQIQAHIKNTWEKIEKLSHSKTMAEGSVNELETNVKSRERELDSKPWKNAEQKYKVKLVQLTVHKQIEDDLHKYYVAMDWAMMHFHKERMITINSFIRELWRLIYRGNDIDYIEIKTDETSGAGTVTAGIGKRRVYNYRVVQVKNGTELDMRSRCSAGQKVLASLIIRMALSETFSMNCGILTLDEPTTNLDRENIRSLSNAIIEIVQEHAAQRNFQLVVITHDHDFLEAMSDADFLSHYYEVSRNHQGKSVIRRKPLK